MIKNFSPKNALILGAKSGIGSAFINNIESRYDNVNIIATSRKFIKDENNIKYVKLDTTKENSWQKLCKFLDKENRFFDLIINATGILHDFTNNIKPEKSISEINIHQFFKNIEINAFGAALALKYLNKYFLSDKKAIFASLSARLGSIEDNNIGGWISYRSSKSAHNMIIKTASIEFSRTKKNLCLVGLHPGTVDTNLSKPFIKSVRKVFTPNFSSNKMLDVIEVLEAKDTGNLFDYNGIKIPF